MNQGAPLDGITVVDLTRALAGPQATMMMADMGARVIKVERPDGGDDSRGWGPPFIGDDESGREATYFLSCNRNKESITLDLKDEQDRDVFRRLVKRADVLMENFRPGTLDKLGLGFEQLQELNPGLIIVSMTGFGHDGPEASRAGYDQIVQGEGGLMSLTGTVESGPTKVGVPIADLLTGMNAAFGAMTALWERAQTGRGRIVRTSLLAGVVGVHAFQGTRTTVAGEVPEPAGVHHPSIAPYGLFQTGSAPVQIACGSTATWEAVARLLDIDIADPRYVDNVSRVGNRDELTAQMEDVLATRPAEEWLVKLTQAGVPAGKVRTLDDVYSWEQTRSQGLVVEVDHPIHGRLELPGPVLRLDDNAYSGGRRTHLPPPVLGEHNASVREWLDQEEI